MMREHSTVNCVGAEACTGGRVAVSGASSNHITSIGRVGTTLWDETFCVPPPPSAHATADYYQTTN